MTAEKKDPKTAEEKAPAKKAPAKKAAPKKEGAKKAAPKKTAAKKAEPEKASAAKAEPKKETAKRAAPKKTAAKAKAAKAESAPEKKQAETARGGHGLLKITQVKSQIGFNGKQKKVLAGLGLGRIGRTVTRKDDACIRGMIAKVTHLVAVEKVEG